ncbi:MAG: MFS transporter [Chloroflexi bacterium]|nr:MFS transporter [Chloroflexota bacterium]
MGPEASKDKIFVKDFTLTFSASLLFLSVTNLLMPVVPLYVLAIGGNDGEMGVIVAAYYFMTLASRPLAGRWIARVGTARLMRLSAGALCLSIFAYLLASEPTSMLAVRVAHGATMGLYSTSANTLVTYLAPARRRGETMSFYSLAITVSQAVGPALGIFIMSATTFNGLFVTVSLLAIVPAFLVCPVDPAGKQRPTSRQAGSFLSRAALLPSFGAFVGFFAVGPAVSYVPAYAMKRGLGNPGLFFTAYALAALLVRLAGGRLSDVFGRTRIVVPANLLVCASMLWLSVAVGAWSLLGVGAAFGVANGLLYPPLAAQAIDRSSPEERGSAMATFLGSMELGIALGATLAPFIAAELSVSAVWVVAGFVALLGAAVYTREAWRERPVAAT